MSEQHPITPPPNLVRQWIDEPQYMTEDQLGKRMYMISLNEVKFREIISKASQYGADQELEACCEWLAKPEVALTGKGPGDLRASRRPKPPSLKEQALEQLACIQTDLNKFGMGISTDTIRRALEALND
jgi:hypothetical protein